MIYLARGLLYYLNDLKKRDASFQTYAIVITYGGRSKMNEHHKTNVLQSYDTNCACRCKLLCDNSILIV